MEAEEKLPANMKRCPACNVIIEKIGGGDEMLCGAVRRAAGDAYAEALGGCGLVSVEQPSTYGNGALARRETRAKSTLSSVMRRMRTRMSRRGPRRPW